MCIVYLPDFICAIKKVELYVVHPYVNIYTYIYIYIRGWSWIHFLWWCIHPCVDFHLSSSIVILEWIEHPWKPHIHPYLFYFRMIVIYCNIIYLCTYHIYIYIYDDGWRWLVFMAFKENSGWMYAWLLGLIPAAFSPAALASLSASATRGRLTSHFPCFSRYKVTHQVL